MTENVQKKRDLKSRVFLYHALKLINAPLDVEERLRDTFRSHGGANQHG